MDDVYTYDELAPMLGEGEAIDTYEDENGNLFDSRTNRVLSGVDDVGGELVYTQDTVPIEPKSAVEEFVSGVATGIHQLGQMMGGGFVSWVGDRSPPRVSRPPHRGQTRMDA